MNSHTPLPLTLMMVGTCIAPAAEAPVCVMNWADDDRRGWPVTGGAPLPKGAATDVEQIRLLSDGSPVPLQAEPLAGSAGS